MSKTCDQCFYHVYDYLDQELGRLARWRIQRHLRRCPGCLQAYGFEQRLLLIVKAYMKEDIPPELLERLRRALGDES
jgi:anti-sigma factor (TIGR02949 family)